MYRWFQHWATLTRRFHDVGNVTCASIDSRCQRSVDIHHDRFIIIDLTTRRRRALALSFLVVFAISIVASWHLPAPRIQANEILAIKSAGAPVASKRAGAKSFTSHAFTLAAHPPYKARIKWSLLDAESESEVKVLISLLNEAIHLPADVEFSFEKCRDSNVFYDDDSNQVVICRRWLDDMERVLSHSLSDRTSVRQTLQSVASAVFLHETAHALIDVLDIPVTGREEDAADQFSTLVLLSQKDGVRKALQVADVYKVFSQDAVQYPPVYWGEHSLNIQRYYDTLCMIYGRDPKQNGVLLTNDQLPKARAEICESEYKRIESSWKRLLTPHAKNNSLWRVE